MTEIAEAYRGGRAMTKCPKCGLEQDPVAPVCIHMAGKKGGAANYARRGPEFYREIGRKGGAAAKASGIDYAAMGRRGGLANIAKNGVETMREIGRRGGEKVKATLGHEHYVAAGQKGGAAVRAAFDALRREKDTP